MGLITFRQIDGTTRHRDCLSTVAVLMLGYVQQGDVQTTKDSDGRWQAGAGNPAKNVGICGLDSERCFPKFG